MEWKSMNYDSMNYDGINYDGINYDGMDREEKDMSKVVLELQSKRGRERTRFGLMVSRFPFKKDLIQL